MSDLVDDLEAAEDMAGSLANAIREAVDHLCHCEACRKARDVLAEWDRYCRPSCGFLEEGECQDDPECCGCPCNHDVIKAHPEIAAAIAAAASDR